MDYRLGEIFFQLLRIGLWGKGQLGIEKKLSEEEWLNLYSFACTHTVEGVLYDSLGFLDESLLPSQSLRLKWAVRIDQIERHNAKMNEVIALQYSTFVNIGLSPILQKGQGVAACYIKSNHRISGDIDWYFENDGYLKARNLLKEKEVAFQDTAGFSLDYDLKGIHIEHHKRLFDIRSPFKYNYLKKLQSLYKEKQQHYLINNIKIQLLAPELQLLQVNAHILKHMISFGIGFRQICDVACLYSKYADQLDRNALYSIYKKAGILEWIHILHHILEKYIGLSKDLLPFDYPSNVQSDWMLKEIWHGGNFGYHDDRYVNGKTNKTISVQPDAPIRLWSNFKRYFPYAPQEAIFFPIVHLYSKILGIDKD